MRPELRDRLMTAAGRLLLQVAVVAGAIIMLVGLGLGVGLFWRTVRWVNGW